MPVGDDVMQGQQQDVTRGADTEQIGAHWWTGFKVERLDGCAAQRGIECWHRARCRRRPSQIVQAHKRAAACRAAVCRELAIRALEEARAQTLMLLRDAA